MDPKPDFSDVASQLHDLGAVKFGEYELKGGIVSPIYFDLRVIVSRPKLLKEVSKLLWEAYPDSSGGIDLLCGVPYTALPLASLMSAAQNKPMVVKRKEAKGHGTKRMLEGRFEQGQNCLIVEDVITSGSSVMETAKVLRDHGLVVTDAVVFLDRQQGGRENLESEGIRVQSVTTATSLMDALVSCNKISTLERQLVIDFISGCKSGNISDCSKDAQGKGKKLALNQRLEVAKNPLVVRLLGIMVRKRSNLCVAADVDTVQALLDVAAAVGDGICCLKMHVDMIRDWDERAEERIIALSKDHDFLLFEDRKYADIGNTVKRQFYGGHHRVGRWADLITVNALPGIGVLKGLQDDGGFPGIPTKPRGAVIVAEMSCEGNLVTSDYVKGCMEMCKEAMSFSTVPAVGVVSQSSLTADPDLLQFTPGVNLFVEGDSLSQRYVSVEEAVCKRGADIIIVGRGIVSDQRCSNAMAEKAEIYRSAGWEALLKRAEARPA